MATAKKTQSKEKKTAEVTLKDIWAQKMEVFKTRMNVLKGEEKNNNKIRAAKKEVARMWTKFNNKQNEN